MKTFQNRGGGFDVDEALGITPVVLYNVADQTAELVNRRHMRRDVIDDEIANFFRLKEKTTIFILTERAKKLRHRIRGFSADDEIFLVDDEISNFSGEMIIALWKVFDGGFKFGRS